ncbi:MAG TPA: sulfatase-like hydrolase/transferase [Chthoniobacterales bacterium]|nr:sulfatase-like hydrolase/transferase [Chthoniobacterales bacterium]
MALSDLPKNPNIVFLITDQQTSVPFMDPDWAAANLPAMNRLRQNGLAFERAHCNSCTCSPSRATLFTGMFPAHHKVTQVLEYDQPNNDKQQGQQILPGNYQTMAKMLKAAGYNVAYKGKFHLNKPVGFFPGCQNGDVEGSEPEISGQLYWSQADVKNIADNYGFDEWTYPDAGDDAAVHNFGGGDFNNDGRFVDGGGQAARYGGSIPADELEKASALHYLEHYRERHGEKPFFLVVSLVNPHDVLSYPGTAGAAIQEGDNKKGTPRYQYAGYSDDQFKDIPVTLPATRNEDLWTKPTVQEKFRQLCQAAGPINSDPEAKRYLQFYAYLTSLADHEIMKVLQALDDNHFTEKTLILRISDHGDMAMAHGMQRQKMYNVYRETLNVPMIFSNPRAFPIAQTTRALAGLIDLMPTMADIVGVNAADWTFQGKSLKRILEHPGDEVQDYVHYTYDDDYVTTSTPQEMGPSHIRCIVEKNWKYAVYFDPHYGQAAQFEMYDLVNDPEEATNLAAPGTPLAPAAANSSDVPVERARLHRRLTEVMEKLGTKPDSVVWPPDHAPSEEDQQLLGVGSPTPTSQSETSSSALPP